VIQYLPFRALLDDRADELEEFVRAEDCKRKAALPPLTGRYTRIALTQRLRRLIEEGTGLGMALEGISAADVTRSMPTQG
jgi:hypothetical protein